MDAELKDTAAVYVCEQCGYIYNPSKGDRKGNIPPGTSFEDLPDDWKCPLCGAKKTRFSPML
jgi:rubredoxin